MGVFPLNPAIKIIVSAESLGITDKLVGGSGRVGGYVIIVD
jgi:hypothetical protein